MNNNTFSIHTLGCKLNFSESSAIAAQLKETGFYQSNSPKVIIVNSCAVTESAVKKTRHLISRLHRENPEAQIVLIGCYAALQPALAKQWPGVTALFGSEDKMCVIPWLKGEKLPETPVFSPAFSVGERTRSFLKIQDGCDHHCSYCTVAKARGKSRSDTIEGVIQQMNQIAALDMKEVNLTGVNIGDFGKHQQETFFELLKIIEEKKPIERVRISSIEPDLLEDRIIDLVAQSEILMPHFHIPLQSGSDRILGLMRRRYKKSLFADKINLIKKLIPDACIAIDVIAGFPTETEEDFEECFQFIKELPISYLHVFTYSKRPDTPAATMQQVQENIKKQRTDRLLTLSTGKKEHFYHQCIGQIRPVLFESNDNKGFVHGFTDNYLRIKQPFQKELINQIEEISLSEAIFSFED